MKKFIVVVLLIAIITGFSVLIYATNDKILNVENKEVKFFNEVSIDSKAMFLENVEKNKNIMINDEEIKVEYLESKRDKNIYISEDNNEYIFDEEKLVGFIKEIEISEKQNRNVKIEIEKAKEIAENFGKDNIQDFEKYEIVYFDYVETYNEYSIKYMRKLNGLMTQDVIKINIDEFGEIVSFAALHQGEFDKFNDLVIEVEAINSIVINSIKNKYGEEIKETEIEAQFLRVIDNKLVLQTEVKIIYQSENGENITGLESLIYEIN